MLEPVWKEMLELFLNSLDADPSVVSDDGLLDLKQRLESARDDPDEVRVLVEEFKTRL